MWTHSCSVYHPDTDSTYFQGYSGRTLRTTSSMCSTPDAEACSLSHAAWFDTRKHGITMAACAARRARRTTSSLCSAPDADACVDPQQNLTLSNTHYMSALRTTSSLCSAPDAEACAEPRCKRVTRSELSHTDAVNHGLPVVCL